MATNTDGGTTASLNNTPQAKDDFYAASEDAVLYFAVMANDLGGNAKVLWSIDNTSDDGSTDLVARDVAGVCEYSELGAKISLTSDGLIRYDTTLLDALDAGQTVTDQFTYAIRMSNGTLSWATVTVTLSGTNDAPVAAADVASVAEDASTSGSVATNDDDVDNGAVLTYALVDPAPTGLTFGTDGSWSFDASSYDSLAEDEQLVLTIPYTVTDEHGASDSSTLTITVTGTNDAPALTAAQSVLADGTEDTSYNLTTAQLLTGFSDPDSSDVLAVFGLTADHGSVVQNLDGSYTIAPEANYNGPVTLSYSVIDGNGGSVPATLTFNLAPVNDPAAISGDTTGMVMEETPANPGTPTATGTLVAADVDNPPNTFISVASTPTASGYGFYTMSATGVWSYTLNNANSAVNALATGMFLIDTFTVQSADGTNQTISVTIQGATDAIILPPTHNGADPNDFDTLTGGFTVSGNHTATNGNDTFTGDGGNQTLNGQGGNDTIYAAGGNDNVSGNNDNDTLYGQAGIDTVSGNNGLDTLYGGSGNDILVGGNDGDTIFGGSGDDSIDGSGGNDVIIGGYGSDTLTGGANDDTFRFLSTLDTNDFITDFMASGDDQIDVLLIDANPGAVGDQAFGWGGTAPTANGLWFSYDAGTNTTILYGDTDGNTATAEFMLTLQNYNGFNPFNDPLTPPPDISF